MSRFTIIHRLVLKHKHQLILTYILFSFEMVGSLMRPFFLGIAVNDLIKGSYRGLLTLCIVHAVWLIAGTFRHMYDTRTYSAIYTSLVTKFLSRKYRQADISKLSAHSNLAREYVDFLEYDLVYIIEAVYNLFGSLILLLFYDWSIVIVCFSILLPVSWLSHVYGKKMKNLNRHKNDELEKQVDIIASGNLNSIRRHFDNLRKWQIHISDKEAWNFGIMEILVMITIGVSLIITKHVNDMAIIAGNLIAMYSYILKFVTGLDTIPYIIQRLSSLHDITQRIEFRDEDFQEEQNKTVPIYRQSVLLDMSKNAHPNHYA